MNCAASSRKYSLMLTGIFSFLLYPGVFAGEKHGFNNHESVTVHSNEESSFSWSSDRKLTWDDFHGNAHPGCSERVAAVTYCSIGLETSFKPGDKRPLITVYNLFHTDHSWSRNHFETPEVLAHEQCHFDICELFTRKLRDRLAMADINTMNMDGEVNRIYDEVRTEYNNFQEQYESETNHGLISDKQSLWEKRIAQALSGNNTRVAVTSLRK